MIVVYCMVLELPLFPKYNEIIRGYADSFLWPSADKFCFEKGAKKTRSRSCVTDAVTQFKIKLGARRPKY
jgi:hypothetical protein